MITTSKLSDDRYDVFTGETCIGDFSRKPRSDEPFFFFPIQFRYNITCSAELLQSVVDGLKELNKPA